MMKVLALVAVMICLVSGSAAHAERINPDPDFSMDTPKGWDYLLRDIANLTHPTVAHVLDCVDDDPSQIRQVGWKLDDKKVIGAYCISYRKSGMRPAAVLLQHSKGKEHEALAKKFIDTYAAEIQSGYQRRNIPVTDMSADLFDTGDDLLMILDARISDATGEYMRSATLILHDDALVKIGTVYRLDAPSDVTEQLEAMPLSITWRR